MNRLTKTFETTDPKTLEDFLSCIMATIEDGLLQSGFIPNEDYTRRDLMNAAMPMVINSFNEGSLTFSAGWNN